jgi:hypothetical protein
MVKRTLIVPTFTVVLSLSAGFTWAAVSEPVREQVQTQVQTQSQEQVYGSQLMTPQERIEYHARMRASTTAEEREQIRNEHHGQMQVRAKERGVALPDSPPVGGRGMGPEGGGMGTGGGMMGPGGGGMGSGGRRGR